MHKRVGLLAGLLVLALGSGVAAQSPSPEPPPWLGGRVEMPEHGFAVTIPDDWVAFDTAVDYVVQLGRVSDVLDPALYSPDDVEAVSGFSYMASEGIQLAASHATSINLCAVGIYPVVTPLGDVADFVFETYMDDPAARGVEPPQPIDLAGGPAFLITMLEQGAPDLDVWEPTSVYMLGADERLLMAACSTTGTRPADDWLSIAETLEFLPAEG